MTEAECQLPMIYLGYGLRGYGLRPGRTIVFFAFPFPREEQEPGAWVAALIHMQIDLFPTWPFVRFDVWCADRWKLYHRKRR